MPEPLAPLTCGDLYRVASLLEEAIGEIPDRDEPLYTALRLSLVGAIRVAHVLVAGNRRPCVCGSEADRPDAYSDSDHRGEDCGAGAADRLAVEDALHREDRLRGNICDDGCGSEPWVESMHAISDC